MGINRVNVSGNLSRDPELRQTQGGTAILTFGVAVNDRRRNPQTQQWEDYVNWIDCVVFGNRAESLSRMLRKGMKCAVEGKLRWSQYQDKQGQKRSKIEVIVDEVEFLSQPQNATQSAPQPQYAPQQQPVYANPPQQQMAPQMAPQAPQMAPAQGYAAAPGVYQPPLQPQAPQQASQDEFYQDDIPFDVGRTYV